MACSHLLALEDAILAAGHEATFRGQVWSEANEWVYFDCILDLDWCREEFSLPDFVADHVHQGTLDGCEQGLVCEKCLEAVVGRHPSVNPSGLRFP